ncbi:MAG TPA: WD40 repeat domain-containing protein [Ktedonobacteraceae bacterium]|nr:WD40 repeat domain-containing protein [Ktedonobacteraceae bacterium]
MKDQPYAHNTPLPAATLSTVESDLLTLRGYFQHPELTDNEQAEVLYSVSQAFPLTDEHAILVSPRSATLVHAPTRTIYWTIICPSVFSAFHRATACLALAAHSKIFLWNVLSGQLTRTLDIGEDVPTDITFSADGALLAIALYNDGVCLWNTADGALLHTLQVEEENYPANKSVAISPDAQFIATGNFENDNVWLWRTADGQLLNQMEAPTRGGRVEGLAFSPNGDWLVCGECGGGDGDTWMRLWDVATGRADDGFDRRVWKPVFHPDGHILATTCIEENVRPIYLWDVETRGELRCLAGHRERVSHISFSPGGRMLISCADDRTVRWWDLQTGQERYRIETLLSTRASSAFNADLTLLATGASDGAIRLWQLPAGKLQYTFQFLGSRGEGGVALSADGQHIASWTQAPLFSGSLCIWQTEQQKQRPQRLRGPQQWIYCAAFNYGGDLLAAGCEDNRVRLWDMSTNLLMHTCEGHEGRISSVAFNLQDTLLASGSTDRTISLWNMPSGTLLMTLEGHQQTILSLAFSPNGSLLAAGSGDGMVYLWNLESGQLYNTLHHAHGSVVNVAFSSDGKRLASTTYDGYIRVWNLENLESDVPPRMTTEVPPPRVLALNSREQPLSECMLLWSILPGITDYQITHEHTHLIASTFQPDGTLLVTGYCSGATQVWRLEEIKYMRSEESAREFEK